MFSEPGLALEAAKGQSAVGSWGHGFAIPDGRLGGYGMMNSPGVPLTISLVLARKAGVKDPAVDLAIERSADAQRVLDALRERLSPEQSWLVETGSAVGAHAGPGALVVSVQPLS